MILGLCCFAISLKLIIEGSNPSITTINNNTDIDNGNCKMNILDIKNVRTQSNSHDSIDYNYIKYQLKHIKSQQKIVENYVEDQHLLLKSVAPNHPLKLNPQIFQSFEVKNSTNDRK